MPSAPRAKLWLIAWWNLAFGSQRYGAATVMERGCTSLALLARRPSRVNRLRRIRSNLNRRTVMVRIPARHVVRMIRHELNHLQRAFRAIDVRQLDIRFPEHRHVRVYALRRRLPRLRVMWEQAVDNHRDLWRTLYGSPHGKRTLRRPFLHRSRIRRQIGLGINGQRYAVVARMVNHLLNLQVKFSSAGGLRRGVRKELFVISAGFAAAGAEFLRIAERTGVQRVRRFQQFEMGGDGDRQHRQSEYHDDRAQQSFHPASPPCSKRSRRSQT